MGSLLERELIKKDFEEKYPILVQMMNKELDVAKEIYDKQIQIKHEKGKIPIHKNMPSVTGGLKWAQELKQRISEPMSNYKQLDHPYVFIYGCVVEIQRFCVFRECPFYLLSFRLLPFRSACCLFCLFFTFPISPVLFFTYK